jgi:hypothetical protein
MAGNPYFKLSIHMQLLVRPLSDSPLTEGRQPRQKSASIEQGPS